MEWGNFWSSHLPRTSYDVELDADSPNPNHQVRLSYFHILEKFFFASQFKRVAD